MIVGFEPVIAKDTEILILGSMPSVTSLTKKEYYGFAHNRFWKVMSQIYQMPIDTYEEKININKKDGKYFLSNYFNAYIHLKFLQVLASFL